jgi:hypothetical protein
MNGTTIASTGGLGNIPTTWTVVGIGDFNGDGKSDLLWRDTSGKYCRVVHERRVRRVDRISRQRADQLDGAIGQR